MMKRIVLALLSILAASAMVFGQGSGAEQSIRVLMEQQRQAALRGDAATYSKLLSDDYVGINYFGAIVTKTDILQNLESGKMKYESIDVSDEKVRVYGNTVVVNSTANIRAHMGQREISGAYRIVRIWVKRNGQWQSISFQATRVEDKL
jgi:hypothetical protein